MRLCTLTIAALAVLMPVASASAAVVIDQSNLVDASKGRLLTSSLLVTGTPRTTRQGEAQTVRAGLAGLLSIVDLQLALPETGLERFAFSLYDGNLLDGDSRLLGRIDLTRADAPSVEAAQAGALLRLDVSTFGYRVTPGQEFTLFTSVDQRGPTGEGPRLVYGRETADGSDVVGLTYSGGYNKILLGSGVQRDTEFDRGFRTFVDVPAVPEPDLWAMLILGFGGVGGALRTRRRRRVAVG